MQRSAIRLLRPAASLRQTHQFIRLTSLQLKTRNMSEIKKVFTKNACPREYRTVLAKLVN
jgi:hypothetical protein